MSAIIHPRALPLPRFPRRDGVVLPESGAARRRALAAAFCGRALAAPTPALPAVPPMPLPCGRSQDPQLWETLHTLIKRTWRWEDARYVFRCGVQRHRGAIVAEVAHCRGCGSTLYKDLTTNEEGARC